MWKRGVWGGKKEKGNEKKAEEKGKDRKEKEEERKKKEGGNEKEEKTRSREKKQEKEKNSARALHSYFKLIWERIKIIISGEKGASNTLFSGHFIERAIFQKKIRARILKLFWRGRG